MASAQGAAFCSHATACLSGTSASRVRRSAAVSMRSCASRSRRDAAATAAAPPPPAGTVAPTSGAASGDDGWPDGPPLCVRARFIRRKGAVHTRCLDTQQGNHTRHIPNGGAELNTRPQTALLVPKTKKKLHSGELAQGYGGGWAGGSDPC